MAPQILIIGAGAIGRGYLPWVFKSENYEFIFVDSNSSVINQMRKAGGFTTFRARNKALESLTVPVKAAYMPEQFKLSQHPDIKACFINVGPRNAAEAARLLEGAQCPIVLCENEPSTVDAVKAIGLENSFFAVPDVITSNTAPAYLLEKDPLSVVSEDGILFMDERVTGLKGDFSLIPVQELLDKQWTAKLYLHNTPHCVAAYLGALSRVTYIHEALAIPQVEEIVQGSMVEMLSSLKLKWSIPHPFLDWYAEKEMNRFRNALLFDPISRVAREPLRKLELEGRLIGAAQICLSLGFIPQNILFGIASALLFENELDSDRHLAFMRRALTPTAFVTHVLGLRRGEALEVILEDRLDSLIEGLQRRLKSV